MMPESNTDWHARHDVAGPSFHQLPAYLKSISYGHPTNITDGPFQYAHKTSSPFFMWLAENPELATCFNNYMSGYRAGKPSWVDPGFYPVQERLIQGMKSGSNEVLLVDVGGGLGHDLELLKQKYPQFPGRLILQDKQDVIDQIPGMKAAFEKTVHDFFTPQPVHGKSPRFLEGDVSTRSAPRAVLTMFGYRRSVLPSALGPP